MRKLRTPTYEPIVPVYPEEHDMLLIQGERPGDIWHGKVLSINRAKRIVDVYFFIEKPWEPRKFVRETFGRAARNSVPFDSILAVASGTWTGTNFWIPSVSVLFLIQATIIAKFYPCTCSSSERVVRASFFNFL